MLLTHSSDKSVAQVHGMKCESVAATRLQEPGAHLPTEPVPRNSALTAVKSLSIVEPTWGAPMVTMYCVQPSCCAPQLCGITFFFTLTWFSLLYVLCYRRANGVKHNTSVSSESAFTCTTTLQQHNTHPPPPSAPVGFLARWSLQKSMHGSMWVLLHNRSAST